MKINLRPHRKTLIVCLILFIAAFAIYLSTGEGHPTYYNYYVRLADAFLHGRLYVLENPSWLNELIPNPNGPGFYVVYPPLPAFIMTPLVAIFGLKLDQTVVSLIIGSLTVPLAFLVSKAIDRKQSNFKKENVSKHLWTATLFGFGTIFWWLSSTGSVWLIAQVFSAFFLLLALLEAFTWKRPLVTGLLVGASFWCRLPTILGVFFFAGLIVSDQAGLGWPSKIRSSISSLIKLGIGAGIFVIFDMIYNFVRFGSLFDVGYWMIPGILNEPWFSHGLFSLQYIPENLAPFLTGLPRFSSAFPFIIAPITGIAIWFTTPAFIFALKSRVRDPVTWSAWISIFAIAFVIFTKGLSGWGFGYRYAVDFYPFLFLLTVRGIGDKIKWYHVTLIILGIIVNFLGVMAFNKFPS